MIKVQIIKDIRIDDFLSLVIELRFPEDRESGSFGLSPLEEFGAGGKMF
jgi:hypothetical protein